MDFNKMVELTDNIIQVERTHVTNNLEESKLAEYEELISIRKRRNVLEEKINKYIPKELLSEFNEYIDSFAEEQSIYEDYYFKQGVDAGLGNLNYLKKFGLHLLIEYGV